MVESVHVFTFGAARADAEDYGENESYKISGASAVHDEFHLLIELEMLLLKRFGCSI